MKYEDEQFIDVGQYANRIAFQVGNKFYCLLQDSGCTTFAIVDMFATDKVIYSGHQCHLAEEVQKLLPATFWRVDVP